MWAYVLVMWLVRKPGAAIFLGIIESAIEVLLGNSSGIATIGWGISQGLAIEVVMAIAGYEKFGLIAAIAAGMAASQFGTVFTALLYGWDPATANDVWMAMPINLMSGAILSGVIGFYLSKALARTGLIRSAGSA